MKGGAALERSDKEIAIRPIAYIETGFKEKFGIPRQSGMVDALKGRLVFLPEYRTPTAFRGLEAFSHVWLLWYFSEAVRETWNPTVRPPRLGGNARMGVFATRSPFRPNNIGLSCVRLEGIDYDDPDGPVLLVSGVDMLDGTPIFDVKPYIPVTDCRADATEGYTKETRRHRLAVHVPESLTTDVPQEDMAALLGILENDPRPGYDDDPMKEYGLTFAGYDVGFFVEGETLRVVRLTRISEK